MPISRTHVPLWNKWSASAAVLCCAVLPVGYIYTSRAQDRPAAPAQASGHREYETFRGHVREQLMSGEFAELEKTAAALTQNKERFPGGDWKLFRFYQGLGKPAGGDDDSDATWQRQMEALEKWLKAKPQSTAAHIALAEGYTDYAWKARGSGFAETVPEQGWDRFYERLARARAALIEVRAAPDKGPHWYSTMQTVALGEAWDQDEYDALFEEAVRNEPLYYHFYSARARYLLPRWYGEEGDWERFADASATKIGGKEGSILYAHIAWEMSRHFRINDFFSKNQVSWPRIRQGYLDREALYGQTVRHLNELCLLAGGAADRSTMRQLLPRIDGRWDEDVWKEKKYFDNFERWAGQ
jgi:hypothetical protein